MATKTRGNANPIYVCVKKINQKNMIKTLDEASTKRLSLAIETASKEDPKAD